MNVYRRKRTEMDRFLPLPKIRNNKGNRIQMAQMEGLEARHPMQRSPLESHTRIQDKSKTLSGNRSDTSE